MEVCTEVSIQALSVVHRADFGGKQNYWMSSGYDQPRSPGEPCVGRTGVCWRAGRRLRLTRGSLPLEDERRPGRCGRYTIGHWVMPGEEGWWWHWKNLLARVTPLRGGMAGRWRNVRLWLWIIGHWAEQRTSCHWSVLEVCFCSSNKGTNGNSSLSAMGKGFLTLQVPWATAVIPGTCVWVVVGQGVM